MTQPNKYTARDIERAISSKHFEDVVVHQCKNGPSGKDLSIMDSWVMPRSWAHPEVTAYEIKVSRSDFMADRKWHKYLDYCNYFYFVCPWKMIEPSEVPYGVGLCYLSQTGSRLFTKVKAPYRDVKIPEELWRYILMCRSEITRERTSDGKQAYWEQWLEDKKMDWAFGRHVSKSINEKINEEIAKVELKQRRLDKDVERYKWVADYLEKLGIKSDDAKYSWRFEDMFKQRLEEVKTGIGKDLIECMQSHKESVERTLEILTKHIGGSNGQDK